MDIKQIAAECYLTHEAGDGLHAISVSLIEFAQKIIAARDAEWMVEPVAYVEWTLDEASWYLTYSKSNEREQEPLFKKPKEVK